MTIDQLIAYVRDYSGSHSEQLPAHVGEQVIAALKAGQDMRAAFFGWDAYEDGCKDWDAATKEDV